MEQPLLSAEKSGSAGRVSYEHVGRAGAVIPTASMPGTELSVDEIRSAASFSDVYPPSLHDSLVGSPAPPQLYPNVEQTIGYPQDAYYGHLRDNAANIQRYKAKHVLYFSLHHKLKEKGGDEEERSGKILYRSRVVIFVDRPVLDEVEIRELLIDHVGHRCCWGSRPARTWKIYAIENCNVYVGTIESFIEERDVKTEKEPYLGGEIDGKDKGHELGVWEVDLRSEFPVLFTPHKETRTIIPHSESIEKCSECTGRGDIVCPSCNADQDPGFYKENQMSQCPTCYGRGLIAHKDGSDTICLKCNGKGMIPCVTCGSRGLIKCEMCRGGGSVLKRQLAIIKWKTFEAKKVSAASGAASVPDDVFHRAKGVQLCNTQAYQCTPAFYADSYFLNKFSSEVISERVPVPPTARVICERHIISVVPVTRVTMTNRGSFFSFYIIGTSREVYLKDSYPSRFCWGICPCLEWLKL